VGSGKSRSPVKSEDAVAVEVRRGSNVLDELSKTIYTLPYCTVKFCKQRWYYMEYGAIHLTLVMRSWPDDAEAIFWGCCCPLERLHPD
jgi:hypothetical protein